MSSEDDELGTKRNPQMVDSWLVYSIITLSLIAVGIHAAIIALAWLDYRGKFRVHRKGSVSDRDSTHHSSADFTLGGFRFGSMAELSRQTSLKMHNLTLPGLSPRGGFMTGSSSHNSDEFPDTDGNIPGTDLNPDSEPEMSKQPQSVSTRRLKMRKKIERQRSKRQRRNSNAKVRERMSLPLLAMQYTVWSLNGCVCLAWTFLITDLLFNNAKILSIVYCNWTVCLTMLLLLTGKFTLRMLLVYRLETSFRGTKYTVSPWIIGSLILFIGLSSVAQILLMVDKVLSDVMIAETRDGRLKTCTVDLYYKDRTGDHGKHSSSGRDMIFGIILVLTDVSTYVLTIGLFVKQMVSIMNRCRDRYALNVVRKIIVLSISDVLIGVLLFAVLLPLDRNSFYFLPLAVLMDSLTIFLMSNFAGYYYDLCCVPCDKLTQECLIMFLDSSQTESQPVSSVPSSPRSSRSVVMLADLQNKAKSNSDIKMNGSGIPIQGGVSPLPAASMNGTDLAIITPLPNQSPNFGSVGSESTASDITHTDLVITVNNNNDASEKTHNESETDTMTTTMESSIKDRNVSKLHPRRGTGDRPLTLDAVSFDREQLRLHKIQTSLQDLTIPASPISPLSDVVDTPMVDTI